MLFWFVIIYWIISVAIGLYAAKFVHNSQDFAVAGRLPFAGCASKRRWTPFGVGLWRGK